MLSHEKFGHIGVGNSWKIGCDTCSWTVDDIFLHICVMFALCFFGGMVS